MKPPVTEWRIQIFHGFSKSKSTYKMGVGDQGEARACAAAEAWSTVSRHADDIVTIESREVGQWHKQQDQASLDL